MVRLCSDAEAKTADRNAKTVRGSPRVVEAEGSTQVNFFLFTPADAAIKKTRTELKQHAPQYQERLIVRGCLRYLFFFLAIVFGSTMRMPVKEPIAQNV